ncbi:MAG: hypothetical protein MZW92_23830 [Comamonadaceae bacterium]|nr:hypothetical protein [Comamonadaceae bacterium]
MREKLQNMTPEEKAAAKEKARAKWEAMTPEQQAAAKKRFAERHPKAAERAQDKASERRRQCAEVRARAGGGTITA